jgi:hypothetical protein
VITTLRSLEGRRTMLVNRSVMQRETIVAQVAHASRGLALVDRVLAASRAHPAIAGIAVGGLVLLGPRVLPGWVSRIATIYFLLRRL